MICKRIQFIYRIVDYIVGGLLFCYDLCAFNYKSKQMRHENGKEKKLKKQRVTRMSVFLCIKCKRFIPCFQCDPHLYWIESIKSAGKLIGSIDLITFKTPKMQSNKVNWRKQNLTRESTLTFSCVKFPLKHPKKILMDSKMASR